MDKQIPITQPDYKKIYQEMIISKFPDKAEVCSNVLNKSEFTFLDVIHIQKIIFGNYQINNYNQRHRSYDIATIKKILQYQKDNKLNNTQLANQFKISRNSVTKWKKLFDNDL